VNHHIEVVSSIFSDRVSLQPPTQLRAIISVVVIDKSSLGVEIFGTEFERTFIGVGSGGFRQTAIGGIRVFRSYFPLFVQKGHDVLVAIGEDGESFACPRVVDAEEGLAGPGV
jgi:hypothetical protein